MLHHAADQLAGHILELQSRHGGADMPADLAAQRFESRRVFGRRHAAVQQAVQGFLLPVDCVMNRHEARAQLLDGLVQQHIHLHQVPLDLRQVLVAMHGHAGQQAHDLSIHQQFAGRGFLGKHVRPYRKLNSDSPEVFTNDFCAASSVSCCCDNWVSAWA